MADIHRLIDQWFSAGEDDAPRQSRRTRAYLQERIETGNRRGAKRPRTRREVREQARLKYLNARSNGGMHGRLSRSALRSHIVRNEQQQRVRIQDMIRLLPPSRWFR